ncbi:hypothetical protein, partial [Nocardia abscessus]|uniref:hypothetical protein n=1 Tax=Nocardia abscessus TaxID=120957 RepID=UPI003CC7EFF0
FYATTNQLARRVFPTLTRPRACKEALAHKVDGAATWGGGLGPRTARARVLTLTPAPRPAARATPR